MSRQVVDDGASQGLQLLWTLNHFGDRLFNQNSIQVTWCSFWSGQRPTSCNETGGPAQMLRRSARHGCGSIPTKQALLGRWSPSYAKHFRRPKQWVFTMLLLHSCLQEIQEKSHEKETSLEATFLCGRAQKIDLKDPSLLLAIGFNRFYNIYIYTYVYLWCHDFENNNNDNYLIM